MNGGFGDGTAAHHKIALLHPFMGRIEPNYQRDPRVEGFDYPGVNREWFK